MTNINKLQLEASFVWVTLRMWLSEHFFISVIWNTWLEASYLLQVLESSLSGADIKVHSRFGGFW